MRSAWSTRTSLERLPLAALALGAPHQLRMLLQHGPHLVCAPLQPSSSKLLFKTNFASKARGSVLQMILWHLCLSMCGLVVMKTDHSTIWGMVQEYTKVEGGLLHALAVPFFLPGSMCKG